MYTIPGKIKTIIVDDERDSLEGITLLLAGDKEIELKASCSGGKEAILAINDIKPDLVFLDIQMPVMNGFDVIKELDPETKPVIVFITAYEQHALQAFEVSAFDYLLKPFTDQKFYKMLEKAKKQVRQVDSFEFQQKLFRLVHNLYQPENVIEEVTDNKYLKRLFIKDHKGVVFLKTEDIKWITADDYYVSIHTKEKNYLMRETMNNLESKLDPVFFFRISRSAIVHIDEIRSIEHYSKSEKILQTFSGEKFKMSLSRYRLLKDSFGI